MDRDTILSEFNAAVVAHYPSLNEDVDIHSEEVESADSDLQVPSNVGGSLVMVSEISSLSTNKVDSIQEEGVEAGESVTTANSILLPGSEFY